MEQAESNDYIGKIKPIHEIVKQQSENRYGVPADNPQNAYKDQ